MVGDPTLRFFINTLSCLSFVLSIVLGFIRKLCRELVQLIYVESLYFRKTFYKEFKGKGGFSRDRDNRLGGNPGYSLDKIETDLRRSTVERHCMSIH